MPWYDQYGHREARFSTNRHLRESGGIRSVAAVELTDSILPALTIPLCLIIDCRHLYIYDF